MIARQMAVSLHEEAIKAPVIAILGPRQSGKTTLAQVIFNKHKYVSLEDYDIRNFAATDPRGFLRKHRNAHGVILDEVQHVPALLSYIQTQVDRERKPGYYILTGSQNFLVMQSISQTLAGRISIHTLLPLSIAELRHAHMLPKAPEEVIFKGFYPVIYADGYDPTKWYSDYITTYLERDVRTVLDVGNLSTFKRFMQLCAGRIGNVVNLTSLGNDCGISHNTAKAWLSVLEASYIVFLLQPHYQNFGKRLIKAPKLFFYDVGLACALLGLDSKEQVHSAYIWGNMFESMIIADLYKNYYNADRVPRLSFWRDQTGHEIDCIVEQAMHLYPVEIKAGETVNTSYFENLNYWNTLAQQSPKNSFVVYGGSESQERLMGNVVSWIETPRVLQEIRSKASSKSIT
jgi:uncharacterized protein